MMTSPVWKWGVLIALSLLFGTGMDLLGIPAGLLLGPMLAGIICGARGFALSIPQIPFHIAQSTIGVLVAASISPDVFARLAEAWPIYLGVVLLILMASAALGLMLSHWNVLPGTTAIWGSWPGAATAMTLMALTAAVILGGSWLGQVMRIPAGQMLVPMVIGIVINFMEPGQFQLPEWYLALAYAVLGWRIGLAFSLKVLTHAWKALPKILGAILALMMFSGGLAALLHFWLGIDPVTAYLATSPGGMDSVAIIAASSNVDLPLVMALQTLRFLIVLIFGPPLARFAARRSGKMGQDRPAGPS